MLNPSGFTDKVKINVVNFTKGNSLFYYGMKPSFWSLKNYNARGTGWY